MILQTVDSLDLLKEGGGLRVLEGAEELVGARL